MGRGEIGKGEMGRGEMGLKWGQNGNKPICIIDCRVVEHTQKSALRSMMQIDGTTYVVSLTS
jgi:hypothetical protein